MRTVKQAIRNAERLLLGIPAQEGEPDPRWKAIIEVGKFIETEPQKVWIFIRKWGAHQNEDIRTAIATCLLEHLLEYYFTEFFPEVKDACKKSKRFALTFNLCSQFGQAEQPQNSKAFNELKSKLA
jgi:hypothetical protein